MDTTFPALQSLHAVSLQEYETLVSGREAFISFLLGDPVAAV
ncbi:hypothetical protein [Arthrobacter pullicola]|nr:hypothetical protein [Arthrobacter pullicola]